MEPCPVCGKRFVNVRTHVLNRRDLRHRRFVRSEREKARGLLGAGMPASQVRRHVFFGERWLRRIAQQTRGPQIHDYEK